jgi:hypothetical protein
MTSAFPISAPSYDMQSSYTPPTMPAVASSETASTSAFLQPDVFTVSPAAQQAIKTSQFVDDNGDGQK